MAKVLVIRTSSFGDVSMLVPVVYSVAARYPQDRFFVMTRKAFSPLFESLGFNVSVIALDMQSRHKGIRGLIRMTKRVIGMGFSHVADEHDVLRSQIIRIVMRLMGTKVRYIDKGRAEKENMIQLKNLTPPLQPTVDRYMDVFRKLGFPAEITFTNLFEFTPRIFTDLRSVVTEKTNKWVGIAPFAKHQGKIYPFEKMQKVIETLSQDPNITVFVFGAGNEERSVIDKWKQKYPQIINISGILNLKSEILLISYLDVMLTMDSANMHLASLVQTPVISIWGATHPSLGFYGYKQNLDNAIQIEIKCRPCSVYGDKPCPTAHECMTYIPEKRVLDKIYEVLESKS